MLHLPPVGVEKLSDQNLAQRVDQVEVIGLGQVGPLEGQPGRARPVHPANGRGGTGGRRRRCMTTLRDKNSVVSQSSQPASAELTRRF